MPPQWQVGSFNKPGATGTQQITGIPFLPKALILVHSGADDYADIQIGESQRYGNKMAIGLTASPGDSWCAATTDSELDLFSLVNGFCWSFARGLIIGNFNIFGGFVEAKCDVDSYDIITPGVNYGFTLDWLVNSPTHARKISYIAIGGDILANVVQTGNLEQTGSKVVTGVGFCGDLFIFAGTSTQPDETHANGSALSFGVANHSLEQWGLAIGSGGAGTTNTRRSQSTSACCVQPRADTTDLKFSAALSAVGPDGFTLAQSGVDGASFTTGGLKMGVLCLKGIASVVGSFNKSTAVEVQTVSTPDLTPLGVLLASFQRTTGAGALDHARMGVGAADLFGNQWAMAAQVADNVAATATHADCLAYNTAVFAKYDNNTQTLEALAGLSTVGAGSFAIGWDPCDAVATEMLFLAIGSGSTGTCEEEDEEDPPQVFHCVDDLTDADLISFRWDAGDQGIINALVAEFDHDAETDTFTKMLIFTDDDSVRKYGRRPEVHIQSRGLRTALGADDYLQARAREVFRRFGAAPPAVVQIECFYRKNVWEVGDIICLSSAFIPNLQISGRGVAEEPFEIVDLRPQFADKGRLIATLLDCEALTATPTPPISTTDPGAPGPEEALTMLGLMGVGRGVFEGEFA